MPDKIIAQKETVPNVDIPKRLTNITSSLAIKAAPYIRLTTHINPHKCRRTLFSQRTFAPFLLESSNNLKLSLSLTLILRDFRKR
ncbi:hypothetical protein [Xenorhabdus eapokensis]|nr:hypothetical protein [Xenorhabdus eapokensis]